MNTYNPDVLQCLANLSNDEVFTPPQLANEVLDLLPEEIWSDPNIKFLDPCCKTGVFLREVTIRLLKGLEEQIPDLQERINHILTHQVYGIAITELTALTTRRTLYCSKDANGEYSVCTTFGHPGGNIYYRRIEHAWKDGKCSICGASRKEFDRSTELETHAYAFIHKPIEELFNMKFDVIIGNPPYQLNLGNNSGNSSKSKAIYHKFIDAAKDLNPKYITMIIPSRWMTRSADGVPDAWVDTMINENKLKVLHDFLDAEECFPNVSIRGGVCYFLWDNFSNGECDYYLHERNSVIKQTRYLNDDNLGIIIRDYLGLSILEKIKNIEGDYLSESSLNFSSFVGPKDFFTNKTVLTSSWRGYILEKTNPDLVKCYLNKKSHQTSYGFINSAEIPKNKQCIDLHKVYIPAAGDPGEKVLGNPFYGEPNSVCSQTYLIIGYNQNLKKNECYNIISYIQTKFFRYLVSLKKKTQNAPRKVYELVPIQDFSKPWTDAELYEKYGLTQEEIDYIESMIRPMGTSELKEE